MPRVARAIEAGSRDEDRAGVFPAGDALVLIVADGAGGRAGGRETAEAIVAAIEGHAADLARDPAVCAGALRALDGKLAQRARGGESTAVLVVVSRGAVWGASAGDSGAWLLRPAESKELTGAQVKKPMLGSGAAVPVAFGPVPLASGTRLLIASDGLWKFASLERIAEVARGRASLERAASNLIECVRLPSGGLQDDVAVVLVEA